ncbi:MAG: DUF1501 domain-containing protein [Anaerolineae bacterium]|nr:DUF1501 domain-containing protein [Anaerolineae bacterium]MBL8107126.1 DUF1501 domain-containing protein [Anaerolineales bacterium]MCC7189099.1 DUF1501 domain-containing protein [Anaerolineales bacterium]
MNTQISRRDFLKLAGSFAVAPALPAWMPRMAFAPQGVQPAGDILVVVFQRGGMDGISAVIPHGDPHYYENRSALAIPEPEDGSDKTGIDLDGFFGLHPSLRPLKDLWDEKTLALVHAVGSPDPTHSHFDAMDYMERGTPGEKSIPTGWIGRHLQTAPWQNESPFRAIGMGGVMQAALRGPIPVTTLKSISDFHLQGDVSQLTEIRARLESLYNLGSSLDGDAVETFNAVNILDKIDVNNYTPSGGAAYPETEFGMAMKQVAQIAKAEIGLEVACVDIGGWDTHNQQGQLEGELPTLLNEFSSGLASLYHDLGDRAKNVTIVTMSEFGRRVKENASDGTDHGHGNCMFVLGGGVNGGKVYGQWPGLAPENLYEGIDLNITTDYRDVLGEVVEKRLKNPALVDVFPMYTDWKNLGVVQG